VKTADDYLAEANAIVPRITPEEGIARHKAGKTVFIDVRDGLDIQKSGTIAGAQRVERGFIEFAATEGHPKHKPFFQKNADIVLICGAGGMAALAGKTLIEMGYQHVSNVGGFKAWKDAGGPSEEG